MSENPQPSIRIGVSACLVGENVRYDAQLKRDNYIADTLASAFDLVPVCPEVEVGMSTPREAIDLIGNPASPSLIGCETGEDWTLPMGEFCKTRARELASENLCGFIFKKNSPSCGVAEVPVIQPDGRKMDIGRGFFAAAYVRSYPLLPVVEEDRLADPEVRTSFLERVHARHRLNEVFNGSWDGDDVRDFHRRERCLLRAHSPERWQDLNELMEKLDDFRPAAFRDQYIETHTAAFSMPASQHSHFEILQELTGPLQGKLSADEQRDFIQALEGFATGRTSLVEPVEQLRDLLAAHGADDALEQSYLDLPGLREL